MTSGSCCWITLCYVVRHLVEKHTKSSVSSLYTYVGTSTSCKSEFKRVYEEEGKFNLSAPSVPYLVQLAEIYQEDGSDGPVQKWTSILKVGRVHVNLLGDPLLRRCSLRLQAYSGSSVRVSVYERSGRPRHMSFFPCEGERAEVNNIPHRPKLVIHFSMCNSTTSNQFRTSL